jgi:ribosomal RNA-processing protein 9
MSFDEKYAVTGSKDGHVLCWDCETGKKTFLGDKTLGDNHFCDVYAVLAYNDNIVLSGRKDSTITLDDIRMKSSATKFEGHLDSVTGLAKKDENILSISLDRTVKVWDLRSVGCVDTMFGHQGGVSSIDCLKNTITSSQDRTLRLWNSSDDTHSIYRGNQGSVDCVRFVSDEQFVSGSEDGTINLWRRSQKKCTFTLQRPHGSSAQGVPNWVTCLSTVKNMNIFASGSLDGFIRLWKVGEGNSIQPLSNVPTINAVVNDLYLSPNLMIAALGKEHKLGRWWVVPGDSNKLMICRLNLEELSQ